MNCCLAFVSTTMAVVYGLFAFGAIGSHNTLKCVANAVDFHPYAYQNQTDLDIYMASPGSVDVTSAFRTIILYGFISNCIITGYLIFKMSLSQNKKEMFGISTVIASIGVNVMWIVQFTMLLYYRYSHAGKVCSADYAGYIYTK